MSASPNDIKLSEQRGDDGINETSFANDDETKAFLSKTAASNKNDGDVESSSSIREEKGHQGFSGLSREELERFSSDPMWVKIRWALFIILLVGWVAMLVAAIVIVAVEPKCPPDPDLEWYQNGVAYKVDVEKFQDSNGDGVGDLAGLEQRVDHFEELSVKSVWIGKILSTNGKNQTGESTEKLEAFKSLASAYKKAGVRIVIDLEMNAGNDDELDELVKHWATAGAGGFVLSSSGVSSEMFNKTAHRLQNEILKELNKKDDRARVIIGGEDVATNASNALEALIYQPKSNCSDSTWKCTKEKLMMLGKANVDATVKEFESPKEPSGWRVLKADIDLKDAACNLALKLTIPGTPNVVYGDEIGMPDMSRGYMVWDDSANNGFTESEDISIPKGDIDSVLAQKSTGYEGASVYSLFKDLATVRADEPSLKWGDFQLLDFGDGVVAFVRYATRVAPVVVALNPVEGKAGSLVFGDYSVGQVLVASGVDVPMDEKVNLDTVYLPKGSVLVAKMSQPDPE